MSRSLSFDIDPIDQPAATDGVERRTWCALRIRVGGRTVTRMWDKTLQEERSALYVPAFPIAEWIVQNWWVLLNEPSPTAELPVPSLVHRPWIKRHCLRSAESGLCLPLLYLFNDGRGVCAAWQADERDLLPNMPGEFVDAGYDRLENAATEDALAEFVGQILERVDGFADERVAALKENWRAIREADADEAKFCVTAGRLGLDPYDPSQIPDQLATFIEGDLGDPEHPLARDLTEAADVDSIASQWSWVRQTTAAWQLGPMTKPPPIPVPGRGLSPSRYGYQLAAIVRDRAGLPLSEPVHSVEDVAQAVAGGPFRIQDQNHVPGHGVRAVVGWTGTSGIVVAGPQPSRADNARFLAARALYHALFACDRSERLVTGAYTWDQQASRAFAAEFLAPRAAVTARSKGCADVARVEELANEFHASTRVIENQLANAGAPIFDE